RRPQKRLSKPLSRRVRNRKTNRPKRWQPNNQSRPCCHGLSNDFAAAFSDCRVWKKSAQGSFRCILALKFPRLNSAGSSLAVTSDQSSGVDTGAFGRLRTEYGVTTVCPNAFRKG